MIKEICIFLTILFFALLIFGVVISLAEDKNFATWEEVFIHEDENEIIFVLKNPNPSDVIFAIITVNRHYVSHYILVSRVLQRYQFNGEEYVPFELDEEDRKTIWTFLRVRCGIDSI